MVPPDFLNFYLNKYIEAKLVVFHMVERMCRKITLFQLSVIRRIVYKLYNLFYSTAKYSTTFHPIDIFELRFNKWKHLVECAKIHNIWTTHMVHNKIEVDPRYI